MPEKIKKDNLLKICLDACRRAIAYNFFFSFFINILMLSTSIYSLQILDRVLTSSSMDTLLMLSLIMLVVYVILTFLQITRSFVFSQISEWLDSKLSSPLLESSITFDATTKGSQNLRDLTTIKSFITSPNTTHLFDAPWALIYFIVIFFIHWINGLLVVAGAVILFLLALLNEKLTKKQVEKVNEINMTSMREVDSISRNAEVIAAMGMKSTITNSWQNKINQELLKAVKRVSIRSTIIANITKSIRLMIQMAVMAVGAILVIKNQMSAGGIIATSILTGKALAPFDAAINIYKSLINSKKSYQRLVEVLNQYEEKEARMELPDPKGEVLIEKLIYKLPQSDQMLIKGVNVKIKPGEVVGVIGPSGAGKTTLVRLMMNVLKPSKGCVRLDGSDISLDDGKIAKYVGYLPQDVELFKVNIKDNIGRMDEESSDQDVVKAAQFANVHDLILKLPQGYETLATNLSAGQRQRVALARAFFNSPKLVILDEPNSNLDTEGEVALVKTMQNAKKENITTIIISHRPSILNSVDKILVLQDGEVKMFDEAKKVIKSLSNKANEKKLANDK